MNDLLLCKPGEIFLKGLNKHYFEERLVANVKRRLKPCLLYGSPSSRDCS